MTGFPKSRCSAPTIRSRFSRASAATRPSCSRRHASGRVRPASKLARRRSTVRGIWSRSLDGWSRMAALRWLGPPMVPISRYASRSEGAPGGCMQEESAGGGAPLVWSRDELLASDPCAEPLVAGDVRCHGGFDADGRYRSPRTLHRGPAIRAWQARLAREGAALLDVDRRLMPPQYPNVAQATLLLRHGVRAPVVRALTIISIVEGFGAVIRDVRAARPAPPRRGAARRDGARAPRRGPLRGPRPRRVGLARRGRSQADVGGRARPRLREAAHPRRRAAPHDGPARALGARRALAARGRRGARAADR